MSNKETRSKRPSSAESRQILSLLEGKTVEDSDITKEAGGRPYFKGGETDFSISHSGGLIAVSHVRGSGIRTGCDIELVKSRSKMAQIAENCFSPDENNYIFSGGTLDEIRFYEIWTLKECFIKLRGLGVFDMPKIPSFVNSHFYGQELSFFADASLPILFRLYELTDGQKERYIMASAVEGDAQLKPEIRWFSTSTFACKIRAEIKAAPNPAQTVSPKR